MYVPIVKPANAIIAITESFTTITTFSHPNTVLWNVQYSINAGNAKPNTDKQNAPYNDTNSSKLGIATAAKTKIIK